MADLITATQEWRGALRAQASAFDSLASSMEARLSVCKEMRKEQAKARSRDRRVPLGNRPYINWSGGLGNGGGYWTGDPWHPGGGSGGGSKPPPGAPGGGAGGPGFGNGSGGAPGNGSGGGSGNGSQNPQGGG